MLVCRDDMTMSSANYDTKSQNFCNMTTQKKCQTKKNASMKLTFFNNLFLSHLLINIVG